MKVFYSSFALALVVAGTTSANAADAITVTSWGGALQKNQSSAFMEPFSKVSGVKVSQDEWSGELAKLRAMTESGSVVWDVIDVDPQTAEQACSQGLLDKLDYGKITPPSTLVKGAVLDCAVGISSYATILAYNPEKLKAKPTSITDIFDTQKFPGKRTFHKSPVDTLEVALLADGVPADEVYSTLETPEGVDRAFKKLDTIKKDIVWWEAGAQPSQLLKSGEAVIGLAWNGRVSDANKSEKAGLGVVWDGQIQGFDMWAIPKGSKNKELAYKFIKFTTDPKNNAELSKYVDYGPTVVEAVKNVSPDTLGDLPTAPQNMKNYLVQDAEFWGVYGPDLNARFSTWVSQ
ncbi:ABC transporter substrate-binding protein [Pseudomonas sp. ZM23]|uniref:ABC transporter substrate-binding protein n=1 Tax=Pseudomonas triclosanedens TaxID=2961893 RepID=A0ABY7A191_9PSED|nr:ABC transporter substrate-binding protein [Pseudomonas triclosanedens]MCP8463667.1 ABC transporter substrate-binding protein [Pseudomonas triclosanedens]MCP8468751.1 ABC transporter substrate-binding protein [Pseudomonas triclosanedens]MCP8475473.1 ABC transporter substrate-binding protein [Pseudomonas triclosanedens]WAI50804.1 ABC transporter substrate-binding protein [Pseudomonas triclosanedens]